MGGTSSSVSFTETLHVFKSGDKGVRLACKRGPEVEVYSKCWGRHGEPKEKKHVPEIFKRIGLQKVKGTEGRNTVRSWLTMLPGMQ